MIDRRHPNNFFWRRLCLLKVVASGIGDDSNYMTRLESPFSSFYILPEFQFSLFHLTSQVRFEISLSSLSKPSTSHGRRQEDDAV